MILENSRVEDAFAATERIHCCTDDVVVSELNGEGQISLSIGLIEGDAINGLLMKADMAMYSLKYNGKNTITIYCELDCKTG